LSEVPLYKLLPNKPVRARFWPWLEPFPERKFLKPFMLFPLRSAEVHPSSSLLLSSLDLSDKKVYGP